MGIEERIDESKNWFERAAERVPGYRGYKDKELRREADKLERRYLAERLEGARGALQKVQRDLSRQASLDLLGLIDNVARKLGTIRDRVEFADYGYAGLFDTTKVGEETLAELHRFDVELQERVQGVETLAAALSADSPSLRVDMDLLEERIDAFAAYFAGREHLITGAGR